MIKPQDKRPKEELLIEIPAALMERLSDHAQELDNSSVGYVIEAILQDYFDSPKNKRKAEKPKRQLKKAA